MNMNGARVIERPKEAMEKILSLRKVLLRGPTYSESSDLLVEVTGVSVVVVAGVDRVLSE